MVMMGRRLTPGLFMSISRNEIPACFLPPVAVRTRQKIMSACWARVVQIFAPLTT